MAVRLVTGVLGAGMTFDLPHCVGAVVGRVPIGELQYALACARGEHKALEFLLAEADLGSFEWECLVQRVALSRERLAQAQAVLDAGVRAAMACARRPLSGGSRQAVSV